MVTKLCLQDLQSKIVTKGNTGLRWFSCQVWPPAPWGRFWHNPWLGLTEVDADWSPACLFLLLSLPSSLSACQSCCKSPHLCNPCLQTGLCLVTVWPVCWTQHHTWCWMSRWVLPLPGSESAVLWPWNLATTIRACTDKLIYSFTDILQHSLHIWTEIWRFLLTSLQIKLCTLGPQQIEVRSQIRSLRYVKDFAVIKAS